MANNLALLAAALVVTALAWTLWRARAAAVRHARLARELDAVTAEARELLTASLANLDTLVTSGEPDPLALDARVAARALARLVDAARAYARDDATPLPSAEGCVRLAIAIARDRGLTIAQTGDATELGMRGRGKDACETLLAIFEAGRAVRVSLERDRVLVELGSRDGSVGADLAQRASISGWRVREIDASTLEIAAPSRADASLAEPEAAPARAR